MIISAVSVLVVAQWSSEIPEGLMNNPVYLHLGSVIANDARCPCEIKSSITMAQAASNKKTSLFNSKLDLGVQKKKK